MFGLKRVQHNCKNLRAREDCKMVEENIYDTFCGKCGGMFLFSVGGCMRFSCGCWRILARSCLQLVCKFTSLKLPPSPRQFALIPTWRTFGKDVWVKTSAAELQNSRENTHIWHILWQVWWHVLVFIGGCMRFSCSCWIILARSCLQVVCKFISLKLPPWPRHFALIPTWRTFGKDVWPKTSAAQLQNSQVRKDCKMVWHVLVFSWWLYAVLLRLCDDFGTFLSSVGMRIHQSEATSVAKTVCTDTYLTDLWERCLG